MVVLKYGRGRWALCILCGCSHEGGRNRRDSLQLWQALELLGHASPGPFAMSIILKFGLWAAEEIVLVLVYWNVPYQWRLRKHHGMSWAAFLDYFAERGLRSEIAAAVYDYCRSLRDMARKRRVRARLAPPPVLCKAPYSRGVEGGSPQRCGFFCACRTFQRLFKRNTRPFRTSFHGSGGEGSREQMVRGRAPFIGRRLQFIRMREVESSRPGFYPPESLVNYDIRRQ
jgi:hypothetical protein